MKSKIGFESRLHWVDIFAYPPYIYESSDKVA